MFWSKKKYNILILGCNGMLGSELYERFTKSSIDSHSNIGKVIGLDKSDSFDITRSYTNDLSTFFLYSIKFDYCINCIAYTDTKSAENTEEGKIASYQLNVIAPKKIAEACNNFNVKLIHISTDYVFSEYDSDIKNYSYRLKSPVYAHNIYDEPFPKNIYGMHKLMGEMNVRDVFRKKPKNFTIARTSWLYGKNGNKSFIHKFMKNVAMHIKKHVESVDKDNNELIASIPMTQNEYSVPTSCLCVYNNIRSIISNNTYGIVHAVPDCDIIPSRIDFANEILKYFNDIKLYGINVSEIVLSCVDNYSLYPIHSALYRQIGDLKSFSNWKEYLHHFMTVDKMTEKIHNWILSECGSLKEKQI